MYVCVGLSAGQSPLCGRRKWSWGHILRVIDPALGWVVLQQVGVWTRAALPGPRLLTAGALSMHGQATETVLGGHPASGLKGILGCSLILNYNRRFDVQIKKVWQNSMKTFYENQFLLLFANCVLYIPYYSTIYLNYMHVCVYVCLLCEYTHTHTKKQNGRNSR